MQASKNAPYLENEHGDPPFFFAFLARVDHYLSAWQVVKKSVQCMWEHFGCVPPYLIVFPINNFTMTTEYALFSTHLSTNPPVHKSMIMIIIITIIVKH